MSYSETKVIESDIDDFRRDLIPFYTHGGECCSNQTYAVCSSQPHHSTLQVKRVFQVSLVHFLTSAALGNASGSIVTLYSVTLLGEYCNPEVYKVLPILVGNGISGEAMW